MAVNLLQIRMNDFSENKEYSDFQILKDNVEICHLRIARNIGCSVFNG